MSRYAGDGIAGSSVAHGTSRISRLEPDTGETGDTGGHTTQKADVHNTESASKVNSGAVRKVEDVLELENAVKQPADADTDICVSDTRNYDDVDGGVPEGAALGATTTTATTTG